MRFHFILHEHHRILSTDATVSALDQKKVKYDKRVYCSRKKKRYIAKNHLLFKVASSVVKPKFFVLVHQLVLKIFLKQTLK